MGAERWPNSLRGLLKICDESVSYDNMGDVTNVSSGLLFLVCAETGHSPMSPIHTLFV